MEKYKIYTDGAVSKNGQKDAIGGWAFVIVDSDNNLTRAYSDYKNGATNQQMELVAVIEACKTALEELYYEGETESSFSIDAKFTIYSDSAYVINCFKQNWWSNWQSNGWRTANKKSAVANKELWQQLIPFFQNPLFDFQKVAGHSGDYWNEMVDGLAVSARQG